MTEQRGADERIVWAGRYAVFDEIATGGMATVYLAARLEARGLPRVVALKKLAAPLVKQPSFVAMFLDEAHLSARIRHPNVVTTHEYLHTNLGLAIVMDFILGQSLVDLLRCAAERGHPPPLPVTARVLVDTLEGLHAAHEAKDEAGRSLDLVHRDVSPHNVLVGRDGVARVIDFGIAKAASRLQTTDVGVLKGKYAYVSPEQLSGAPVDRRTDVYSAGIVFWEMVTGRKLFKASPDEDALAGRGDGTTAAPPPSSIARATPLAIDHIVLRALHFDPRKRFATALEMADAVRTKTSVAGAEDVADWVASLAAEELATLDAKRARIERSFSTRPPPRPAPTPRPREPLDLNAAPILRPPLPEAPMRRPVARVPSPLATRRSPRLRRYVLLAVALGGLALAGATVIQVPGVLQTRVIAAAARRGLDLTVGRVSLSRVGDIVLRDARVTFRGCPGAVLTAPEMDLRLDSKGTLRDVSFTGYELALTGDIASFAAHWNAWRAELYDPIAASGSAGHLVWRAPLTIGTEFEGFDVALEETAGPEPALSLETKGLTLNLPRAHVGPWGLRLDTRPSETRVRIALDPTRDEGPPSALVTYRPAEGASLVIAVPRDAALRVGIPSDLLGAGSELSLEALLTAHFPPDQPFEAEAMVGLFGLPVVSAAGRTAPVDLVVEGKIQGITGPPLSIRPPFAIRSGRLTLENTASPLTGTVAASGDGIRVELEPPRSRVAAQSPLVLDTRDWTRPLSP